MPDPARTPAAIQRQWLDALARPAAFPEAVDAVEVIETHISFVLLAGTHAWKLKKAVDLGFLDFRALADRRRLCHDEWRLNRRLAPTLYLDVVAVLGPPDAPRLDDRADDAGAPVAPGVLDYAVRMRRFAQSALLDAMCEAGTLGAAQVDAVALRVAEFHAAVPAAAEDSAWGDPQRVAAEMLAHFVVLERLPAGALDPQVLASLRDWCEAALSRTAAHLAARKRAGRVRECHGDLHLRNVAWIDDAPQIFDCIEFEPAFRWIDVAAEVAFLAMDLGARGRRALAARFIDRWLAASGDYDALAVLPLFVVERALVRAKVAAIRAAQPDVARVERERALGEAARYLACACAAARPRRPALVLMHGLAGSGKSTLAAQLVEALGAVRLRSDIERKRLHGLAPLAHSGSPVDAGLYGGDASRATYARLAVLARQVIEAGSIAVVDASFLARADRDTFAALASALGVRCAIVHAHASPDALRARVAARSARGDDPSEATLAVLARQQARAEPFGAGEPPVVVVDTEAPGGDDWLARLRAAILPTQASPRVAA